MLRHVQRGQPLRIPAADWNAIVDATRAHLEDQLGNGGTTTSGGKQAGVVFVKNASGAAVDRFAVLGIGGPIITPTDNADEFKRQVAVSGVTPTSGHAGKFVILLEPAPSGGIVRAVVAGVSIVKVNVIAAAHEFAEVKAGDAAKLDSAAQGTARILWKESGTGDKWAIVRLGESAPSLIPVTVAQTGGSNGSKAATATYTYTVVHPGTGQTLLTDASPAWARSKGAVNVATHGAAYHNGTTWVLYQVDETPQVGC